MPELKDERNFATLDDGRWEDLCFLLFKEEYPGLQRVEGKGGDEGIDAYLGSFDNPDTIFQFKFFREGLGTSQKRQISRSLETAKATRSGFKWILVTSVDPTPEMQRWLDSLQADNQDIQMEIIYGSSVKSLLVSHPKVRKEFYPNTQDTLEDILDKDGNGPIEGIRRKAGLLNNVQIDDRFKATVTTDGDSTIVEYQLRDWVKQPVKFMRIEAKNQRAVQAIKKLEEEGKPFTLSSEDVKVTPLVALGQAEGEITALTAHSCPGGKSSLLRFYSSGDATKHTALVVELKTERSGTKMIVRSNSDQKACPLLFRLYLPLDDTEETDSRFSCRTEVEPRYIGNSVKDVCRGSRFLYELAASQRFGISEVDGSIEDATFAAMGDFAREDKYSSQANYYQRLWEVCSYFDCNPVLTDEALEEGFIHSIIQFSEYLRNNGKEFTGEVTVNTVGIKEAIEFCSAFEIGKGVAIGFLWSGDLLGKNVEANVRIESEGTAYSEEDEEGGGVCHIKGKHRTTVERLK